MKNILAFLVLFLNFLHVLSQGHDPDLGEMDKILLQKIEEMTLQMIEMKKEIVELNGELENFQDGAVTKYGVGFV